LFAKDGNLVNETNLVEVISSIVLLIGGKKKYNNWRKLMDATKGGKLKMMNECSLCVWVVCVHAV
jgi:hypothetical protein